MAENGINGHSSSGIDWRVGLMNCSKKYLTAESFGFEVNASGIALKKKQIWTIEQNANDGFVYIRSCMGRYMTSDRCGKVKVDSEEKEEDAKFTVEYSANGKWAFKNVAHQTYFKAVANEVTCSNKSTNDTNWWSIQLYVHPQIHLRNVNRKVYAQLDEDTIVFSETVPWGLKALMYLDFIDGKYTLKSCDNRYVSRDGSLQSDISDDTLFDMEIHSGSITFKDCEGRYLTAVGTGKALLKSRSKTISKDEFFTIEDSHPQCKLLAMNGKSVSVKQGVAVSANQSADDISDKEIFQMEFNKEMKAWAFRDNSNNYWNLLKEPANIHANQKTTTKTCFFTIEWQDDGTAGIKGYDGKYLSNKKTGILHCTGLSMDDTSKFTIIITNRPILVLKCDFGFVGSKGNQYSCNKAKYDTLSVTSFDNGTYTIKGQDGKFWNIGEDNMVYPDTNAARFHFLFCGCSMMAIRAPNGCYLNGEQNGLIKATATEITATSKWEF